MLDTLDVLIGFTLVMLIMSMAVTMLTQLIGSALFNMRGHSLKLGIAQLLALLDRGLTPHEAERVANHILRNPLIGEPAIGFSGRYRLANTIHREELVKLILDFAADGDAERANDTDTPDEQVLRKKIQRSLAKNGIGDPAAVLEQVRNAVLELERTSPEMSQSARLSVAILTHAASDFLSKLNSWFDQTVDRVSDVFTARIRLVTVLVAVVLAFVLHIDAIGLMNRLAVDDELRMRLVDAAIERVDATEQAGGYVDPSPPEPAAGTGPSTQFAAQTQVEQTVAAIRAAGAADMEEFGLIAVPHSFDEWENRWTDGLAANESAISAIIMRLIGILLSAALLSLGAPFWYSTLRDLVKLRSLIARKDDMEREERQTTQPPPAAAPHPRTLPHTYRGGEAGDLEPTG